MGCSATGGESLKFNKPLGGRFQLAQNIKQALGLRFFAEVETMVADLL
jgi:hypothetical protein